ncbi:hypothetical protein ABB55_25565 [Prosthecomicrobium hirschii]|uniref:EthD domain-containing protein n=1 Tax=Prosthecodimorpha hirschii TaxID=665126 RepID=A0A0N8GFT1_9HYPH|nr:hypothetical protein [Prosthecomicrobium hirschii]KPL55185.1 hypothetical protein ABB55_25565 [Prosthecomicrobium hirschii]
MTGLLGRGALVNWGGVVAEQEDDYNMWHSREHMPERLAVPGFRRGRRGVAPEGTPAARKYFMMYEAVDAEVFISAPYLARLNDPTPWTRRILSAYIEPSRTVCRVVADKGDGVGGWLATLQFWASDVTGLRAFAASDWIDRVMALNGILGASALEGDRALGQQPTAEKTFRESRGDRDRTVDFALLVEGFDQAPTEAAAHGLAAEAEAATGLAPVVTLYRMQHVITNVDVAATA